jgi:hypothetical protein
VTPLLRAAVIGLLQVTLLGLIGGKLLYDRTVLPRAWIETTGIDPDLPIRGRYVSLNLVLPIAADSVLDPQTELAFGRIEVREGRPVAVLDGRHQVADAAHPVGFVRNAGPPGSRWRTLVPVAYFLSEHARDPTLGARPGELWLEATLPQHGAPRPIQLGSKRGGRIEPIR